MFSKTVKLSAVTVVLVLAALCSACSGLKDGALWFFIFGAAAIGTGTWAWMEIDTRQKRVQHLQSLAPDESTPRIPEMTTPGSDHFYRIGDD